MLAGLLLRRLLRESHDRCTQPLFIDSVDRSVNRRKAAEFGEERVRQFLKRVAEVRHVAHADGCVSVLGTRDGYHRGILEKIVITSIPIAAAVGLGGLEAGAVHGLHLPVLVGHLRTLDL